MTSNKTLARKYFNIYGKKGFVLHHKDTKMKTENPERYNQWNVEDLVVVTKAEHNKIHFLGKPSGNDFSGEKNPMYGKKHSEESKRKMSERHKGSPATKGSKGMHWFNNGEIDMLCYECPEGFKKGRLRGTNHNRNELGQFIKGNTEVINQIAQG